MAKSIVISGIQPTGNLHIGNYLGAVKNWVSIQKSDKFDFFIFIADFHSLSGKQTADERRAQLTVLAAELIAAGLDPARLTLFRQSDVPQHTELAWIFNCVTPVAELERMTQYKDKSANQVQNINTGLLTYPTLMAADILLYHATQVPVGKDQEQHLELTNTIANKFNNAYGEYFRDVKGLYTEIPKVMSLLEPLKKMSKSLGQGHVIDLADEPEMIAKKLAKAVTATEGGGDAPGVQNLLGLLKQFGDAAVHKQFVAAEKDGTIRYGDLKKALADAISSYFADFRAKRAELLANPDKLQAILEEGAVKARAVAEKTMTDVRKLIGIR